MMTAFLVSMILTLALTAAIERFLIPKLKSIGMGQKILDIGPRWHKNKEGTPTMGGLGFMAAATVVFVPFLLLFWGEESLPLVLAFAYALVNGAIGFVDDYTKFVKKQNEGLTAGQKYLLQLLAAALYLGGLTALGRFQTALVLPFFGVEIEFGIAAYVIALLLLTGMVNSVNLTDGVDGLASSVTFVVSAFYAVAAFALGNGSLALLSGIGIGCCVGFLVYNFYPARVFMGDTGSLFLGGLVCGMAFLSGSPLMLLVIGIVYLIESASVILQVGCYKLTKKRIFKMAPIHHHFEKCGWNEIRIVVVFSLVTFLFGVIAYFTWIG
ncbi:MAG: phospho-N-acetylmuramoyl-pentapeptide-transferase [Ruminococcaceae bacterium]|nr:phospho-N-acetylmuramoyl-pentapeptide-transferase [Oscillospiraceae bacterium]